MRTLVALLWALALPAISMAVALLPGMSTVMAGEATVTDVLSFHTGCLLSLKGSDPVSCAALEQFTWLGAASIATAVIGVVLILGVNVVAFLTGWNRTLLALTFPPVALFTLFATGILAFSQIGLLAAASWLAQAFWFEQVIIYIPILLLIAAVGAGFAVLRNAFRFFHGMETRIIGRAAAEEEAPALHGFIQDVAKTLKTRVPDNVVLGLDPTFFATSAPVHTPFRDEPLRGETMFLSLPLMRNLTADELRSIVGHELAHFSGGDTIYSKRFAPVYRGLIASAEALRGDGKNPNILAYPARMILRHVLSAFELAEKAISRRREHRADKAGAKTGSPDGLATSLMRLSVLGYVWNIEYQNMINRIAAGRFSRNLSRNFVERAKYDLNHDQLEGFMADALKAQVAHPTDTHPVTEVRLKEIGVDPAEVLNRLDTEEMFRNQELPEIGGADLEKIEEDISHAYQSIVAHHIHVDQSAGQQQFNAYSNLVNAFLATMVWADGHLQDAEIEGAEAAARGYEPKFDSADFRERCRHPEDLPTLDDLIEFGNAILNTGGAQRLIGVLETVAAADGQVAEAEGAIIARLKAELTGGSDQAEG